MRPLEGLAAQDFSQYTKYLEGRQYREPTIGDLIKYIDDKHIADNSKPKVSDIFERTGKKRGRSGIQPLYPLKVKDFIKLYATIADISIEYLKTGYNQIKKALDSFHKSIGSNYGHARAELIEAYGEYCNYCDTRIPDSSLAIEHLVPKSTFSEEMIKWENFYLACPNCNSKKSNNPPADILAQKLVINLQTLTKQQYDGMKKYLVEQGYMWPADITVYKDINYKLVAVDQNNGSSTKLLKQAINNYLNNHSFTYPMGEVLDNKKKIYLDLMEAPDKVTESINLLGLNTRPPGDNEKLKLSDRRLFNRTKTGISIAITIQHFNTLVSSTSKLDINDKTIVIETYLKQVADTAKFAGFFSLYVKSIKASSLSAKYETDLVELILGEYKNTNAKAIN